MEGLLANANCGGENVHRGAVLGAMLGAAFPDAIPKDLKDGLKDHDLIDAEIEAFLQATTPPASM